MKIQFEAGFKNQLLLNPKMSVQEQNTFIELKNCFERNYSVEDFFFIASSGSSKKENESAKLVALTLKAVLNSAKRFNLYYQIIKSDTWGLVLPTFHVAGLSVCARAYLTQSEVHSTNWTPEKLKSWLEAHRISYLSLVPTQVYDLVQLQVKANTSLKKVFVGGGVLAVTLRQKFIALGWPLVETYGMTETGSMIAVKENDDKFQILPGVKVKAEDEFLQIQCDSIAFATIQKKQDQINITLFKNWLVTEDRVKIDGHTLQFLGRSGDYIKISGEGVSMPELREKLDQISDQLNIKPSHKYLQSVVDARLENTLVLIVENSVNEDLAARLISEFNKVVRPYEKIHKLVQIEKIPLTELGKIKLDELRRSLNDKKI